MLPSSSDFGTFCNFTFAVLIPLLYFTFSTYFLFLTACISVCLHVFVSFLRYLFHWNRVFWIPSWSLFKCFVKFSVWYLLWLVFMHPHLVFSYYLCFRGGRLSRSSLYKQIDVTITPDHTYLLMYQKNSSFCGFVGLICIFYILYCLLVIYYIKYSNFRWECALGLSDSCLHTGWLIFHG